MITRWPALLCCTSLMLLGGLTTPGSLPPSVGHAQPLPEAPKPLLQPLDQGPEVLQLQLALLELGLYAGTVDGIYGAATVEAVRSLQQQQGLVVDGSVGEQTWLALATADRRSPLTLPAPLLGADTSFFTALTVAPPATPPSALWLALMPLVPIIGGALTYLQRRLQRQPPLHR